MHSTQVTISSDFYLTLLGIFIDTLVQIPSSFVDEFIVLQMYEFNDGWRILIKFHSFSVSKSIIAQDYILYPYGVHSSRYFLSTL